MKYHLAERIIDDQDIAALIDWLKTSPRLTKDKLTLEFEELWAAWVGSKYAVFCNSGSSANLLMAYALLESNMLKNKKVVVPSVGWVTTIAPFMQFGYELLMCGADRDNFGLDLNYLETLIKKHQPSCVMLVQVLGVPSDMDALMALKEKYGFVLLEDACAALGAQYDGKKVGSFGEMGSFSFYFGHQLSTIEGGIVDTNNKELYDILLMLRSHGWAKDLDSTTRSTMMQEHHISEWHEPFSFFLPGFNLRSTDLNAFLGIRQVQKADQVMKIRTENHRTYTENLRSVEFQKCPEKGIPCSISLGALAKNTQHRKNIVEALDKEEIETRLFSAGNLGLHPFWSKKYGEFHHEVSDRIHNCGFFLPNNESLKKEDILFISEVVNKVET